jgi:hypothetical protein
MLLKFLIKSRSTIWSFKLLLLTILLSFIIFILFRSLSWIRRSFNILPIIISTCTWLSSCNILWFCTSFSLFKAICLNILPLFTTLLSLLVWLLLRYYCAKWFWLLRETSWIIRTLWHSIYIENILISSLNIVINFINWSTNLFALCELLHSYLITLWINNYYMSLTKIKCILHQHLHLSIFFLYKLLFT